LFVAKLLPLTRKLKITKDHDTHVYSTCNISGNVLRWKVFPRTVKIIFTYSILFCAQTALILPSFEVRSSGSIVPVSHLQNSTEVLKMKHNLVTT